MKPKNTENRIIGFIFLLTGTSTAFISGIILSALNIEALSGPYLLVYIVITLPIYQLLINGYAFIFGKLDWFVIRQKRLLIKGREVLKKTIILIKEE